MFITVMMNDEGYWNKWATQIPVTVRCDWRQITVASPIDILSAEERDKITGLSNLVTRCRNGEIVRIKIVRTGFSSQLRSGWYALLMIRDKDKQLYIASLVSQCWTERSSYMVNSFMKKHSHNLTLCVIFSFIAQPAVFRDLKNLPKNVKTMS